MGFSGMIRKPSAYLPVAMSFAALATVLGRVAMFGAVLEVNEGAAAHVFQLIMVAGVPIVLFFAVTRLPRFPKPAPQVPALQNRSHLDSTHSRRKNHVDGNSKKGFSTNSSSSGSLDIAGSISTCRAVQTAKRSRQIC